ncbi:glycoside hydrolase family 43 protein [candidate division KSB1 bacterium]|nr:glycoside hydrolase family 43 protein [candidate division KSB1 bacterium]
MNKFLIITFLLLGGCMQEKYTEAHFNNPILPGFYPDPSICKVGNNDYYLVNSSFCYFPGIPIFHSKDLVKWQQIGHALDRPEQLDFDGLGMSGGVFAPTIRYNAGTFYITCTLVNAGGNFIITAKDPAGPWSDPIFIPELEHIDPSPFFDDDGTVYLVYNSVAPDNKPLYSGHRSIRMWEYDVKKFQVIGEEILLVDGGSKIEEKPEWIEGPHIYKINGIYYLSAGEGGTYENHSQVVFRSDHVKGPYLPYENNPVLTQRHLNPARENPITSTGHADFVQDEFGEWWAVFLGCRPYEHDYYNTGRETFLAPVKWFNGWPVINPDFDEVQYTYPIKVSSGIEQKEIERNFKRWDNFDSAKLDFAWTFQRPLKNQWYSLEEKPGFLTIAVRPETCNDMTNPSFIGRRQQHLRCTATTKLLFDAQTENEKAGLCIFQNENHYYFIGLSKSAGKNVVQFYQSTASGMELKNEAMLTSNKNVRLRINAEREFYSFQYAESDGDFKTLADGIDARFVSTKGVGGVTFVGSFFGMYATSMGKPSSTKAYFDWFAYEGNDQY